MAGTPSSFNAPPPNNGVGLTGFILSIVGLATCGTLNFLSLPISLIGLLWKPRGFAIAGTIISLLGAGFFSLVGMGIVMLALGLKEGITSAGQRLQTDAKMQEAKGAIEGYRLQNNALPDGIEGNKLVVTMKDAWDTELRYDLDGKTYVIRSAGPDKQFNTEDDITSDQSQVGDLELDFGEGMSIDGPVEVPSETPDDAAPPPSIDDAAPPPPTDEPSIDAPTTDPEKSSNDDSESE